ncbi:MAG: BON domain-containing protein [Bacteroidota bacterium]
MTTDKDLERKVHKAIKLEPMLNAAKIKVTATEGIIILTGIVDCSSKKNKAEDATKQVEGVFAVIKKAEVKLNQKAKRIVKKTAFEKLNDYWQNWNGTKNIAKGKDEDGWITLAGELNWN